MSVYTSVSTVELEGFLRRYALGHLISFQGIENEITNSNFWLQTDQDQFVLTLYEHNQPAALDYILGLQCHLAERGVACATPVIDKAQRYYSMLNHRPAAINLRIKGHYCRELSAQHCRLIGKELAKFHLSGIDYRNHRNNPCGDQWMLSMQQKLNHYLSRTDQKLLNEEIQAYRAIENLRLPNGPCHLDLFHDNCLFDGENLCGIIDFDYACDSIFIYDFAIALNDCCIQENAELDSTLVDAFSLGYESIRPFEAIEQDYLGLMLRLAATRFWLSRLHDLNFPLSGDLTFVKDPDEFKRILVSRRHYMELFAYAET